MQINRCTYALAVCSLALVVLAGCATMGAAVLPEDRALPPAETAFWRHVSDAHPDDWYHVLNQGDEALAWRLRAIDSATASIDMETFLWMPDQTGQQVLARLLAAADRGVRVRILLDDSFTMHQDLALHAIDAHPRIDIRIYNPFRHRPDNVVLRQLFNLGEFSRINHRMHNKALVVDGRAAIVSGRNIADEYFGFDHRFNFRDMELLTAGKGVRGVVRHFDQFWNSGWSFPIHQIIKPPGGAPDLNAIRHSLAAKPGPVPARDTAALEAAWISVAKSGHPGVSVFHSDNPPRENPAAAVEAPVQLAAVLMKLIDGASREVVLVSAYLIPTPELEAAIERARKRGVQVRMLTNSLRSNNHLSAHSAYANHIGRLVSQGVALHEMHAMAADRSRYMQSPVQDKRLGLHAKILIIDDTHAYVGSCNLDPRSLKLNTEVGLVIRSAPLNRALRQMLATDFEPRNAWAVKLSAEGKLQWHGNGVIHDAPPADSVMQRLEDWFLGLLPIEEQM